jgi:hypothetical protein
MFIDCEVDYTYDRNGTFFPNFTLYIDSIRQWRVPHNELQVTTEKRLEIIDRITTAIQTDMRNAIIRTAIRRPWYHYIRFSVLSDLLNGWVASRVLLLPPDIGARPQRSSLARGRQRLLSFLAIIVLTVIAGFALGLFMSDLSARNRESFPAFAVFCGIATAGVLLFGFACKIVSSTEHSKYVLL